MCTKVNIIKKFTENMFIVIFLMFLLFQYSSLYGHEIETFEDPLTKKEREWLVKHDGKIRLGHDPSANPIEFLDSKGIFCGLAADYVKLLEKKLNFKFKIEHSKTWDEAVRKAKKREIDVLCAFTKNPAREKWMLFTEPYIKIPTVILTGKEIKGELSLDEMKDMRVTYTKGWVVDDYLKENYSYLNLIPAINPKTAMNNLTTGLADAWVTALTVASIEIENSKVSNLRIVGEVDFSFKLAFASRKDLPVLNSILNKGIKLINKEERKKIFNRWINIDQRNFFNQRKFWIGIGSITIILLIPVILIFVWNKSLKREVEGHTLALKHELEERRKAEENLKKVIKRLDLATNIVKIGIWDWDIKKNELLWDEQMYELYGIKPDNFQGCYETWLSSIHPEDRDKSETHVKKAIENRKEYNSEFRIVWPDGTIKRLKSSGSVVVDEKGEPIRITGVNFDITKQKKVEEELLKINTIFHSLLEHSPVYIFFKDKDLRPLYLSRNYEEMLGKPLNDIIGKKMDEIFPPDLAESMIADDRKTLNEGKPFQVDEKLNDRYYTTFKFPINQSGKSSILASFTLDITERKKAENEKVKLLEQLHQSQKIQSIGTLAGGIAHDFNNLLTVLTGNISYALSHLEMNSEIHNILSDAMNGAFQAQKLTQQLLTFAKGGDPVKKPCNINNLLTESAGFVTSGAKSKCEYFLADDLWNAEVDSGQFNQTISNLIINADQAMPDGGIIRVKSENIILQANNTFNLAEGKYIRITIEDKGIGIQKKHISSIFDPYFTTKQKGSGLGLATVYSIIKRHGGSISVDSEIDKGTRFKIYLPALESYSPDIEKKNQSRHKGSGRILVMDDQEPILRMISMMIRTMGYEVETSTHGTETLDMYKKAYEDGTPYDLVILDLTIPGGMGGAQTIKELLKIDPHVKAVVSSGYSNDPVIANYKEYGLCGVVTKPYTREDLAETFKKIFG